MGKVEEKLKKVYIAGPLNADAVGYIKNVHNMLYWANEVRKLSFAVFVPAIDFMMGVQFGDWEYEDYFNNSQPFLECCDYVFVCPNWGASKGTKKEIETAKKLNIPIYYSLEELRKGEKIFTTSNEIKDRILNIISENLGVKKEELVDNADLVGDLGVDSLDSVELVMALEEEFGVEIPDEEAEKMSTVIQIVKYIQSNLLKRKK
jgi:acyl carrier protein